MSLVTSKISEGFRFPINYQFPSCNTDFNSWKKKSVMGLQQIFLYCPEATDCLSKFLFSRIYSSRCPRSRRYWGVGISSRHVNSLDECSVHRRDFSLKTHNKYPCTRRDLNPQSQEARGGGGWGGWELQTHTLGHGVTGPPAPPSGISYIGVDIKTRSLALHNFTTFLYKYINLL